MLTVLHKRFQNWLSRRLPETDQITLNHRNLFIFPTPAGFGFLLFLGLLWLVATNYENNLIFAITFLLTSLFVVSIQYTHAGLSGVRVASGREQRVFCGENCGFEIILGHDGRRRNNIQLFYAAGEVTHLDAPDVQQTIVVKTVAAQRGWFDPGRLTIQSHYPLGLFRVWTHIKLNSRALVYPRPLPGYPATQAVHAGDAGHYSAATGSEDFIGLDRYQRGQSLRHVAWKHYAREQGFLTKYYVDYLDQRLWLDWHDLPGLDRETRLSRLCGQVLALSNQELSYGLRLPGIVIQPGQGEAHRNRLLRELALFEADAEPLPASMPPAASDQKRREHR